jgi:hypothetical protein
MIENDTAGRQCTASEELYAIGDRVLWTVLVNNPSHYKPGDKIPGTIIAASGTPPFYRIQLDVVWNEQMVHAGGKPIVVGNISGRQLSSEKPKLVMIRTACS